MLGAPLFPSMRRDFLGPQIFTDIPETQQWLRRKMAQVSLATGFEVRVLPYDFRRGTGEALDSSSKSTPFGYLIIVYAKVLRQTSSATHSAIELYSIMTPQYINGTIFQDTLDKTRMQSIVAYSRRYRWSEQLQASVAQSTLAVLVH